MSAHDDPDKLYRSEFDARELQRDVEAAEEQLERNTRSVADVFVEYMENGDHVEIAVGVQKWIGFVVGVGDELVTLKATNRVLDVALDHLTFARVVAQRVGAGRAYSPASTATLVARLRELNGARTGDVVEIGGAIAPIVGAITAVSASHVELRARDGETWLIPLRVVGFVATVY